MSLRVLGTTGSNLLPRDSIIDLSLRSVEATGASRRLGSSRGGVSANVPLSPTKPPATVVVNGKVTSYRDTPTISTLSVKQFATPGQVEALRSAATNTAKAFNLPIAISADRALCEQNRLNNDLAIGRTITVDLVVDP